VGKVLSAVADFQAATKDPKDVSVKAARHPAAMEAQMIFLSWQRHLSREARSEKQTTILDRKVAMGIVAALEIRKTALEMSLTWLPRVQQLQGRPSKRKWRNCEGEEV